MPVAALLAALSYTAQDQYLHVRVPSSPQSHNQLHSLHCLIAGCAGLTFGGQQYTDLVVSTMDGSLLLVSPSSSFDPLQPDPAGLQVDPLADWHVGPITGIAPAPTGAHLISCGVDGSIRVWAAAAGGQLVSKRDVGGQLTCCTSSGGAEGALLAAGSRAGVLRCACAVQLKHLCSGPKRGMRACIAERSQQLRDARPGWRV